MPCNTFYAWLFEESIGPDFWNGSIASIPRCPRYVRLAGDSGQAFQRRTYEITPEHPALPMPAAIDLTTGRSDSALFGLSRDRSNLSKAAEPGREEKEQTTIPARLPTRRGGIGDQEPPAG
jgi:hypothetical protein